MFGKVILIAALSLWTFVVVAAYGYGHSMSGWSDGAGGTSSNGWISFAVIWAIPVALYYPIRALYRRATTKKPDDYNKDAFR